MEAAPPPHAARPVSTWPGPGVGQRLASEVCRVRTALGRLTGDCLGVTVTLPGAVSGNPCDVNERVSGLQHTQDSAIRSPDPTSHPQCPLDPPHETWPWQAMRGRSNTGPTPPAQLALPCLRRVPAPCWPLHLPTPTLPCLRRVPAPPLAAQVAWLAKVEKPPGLCVQWVGLGAAL